MLTVSKTRHATRRQFNLDAVKAEMAKRMEQAEAASKGPSQ